MNVGPHKFILRGVVMGNTSHFISMVLIEDQWLWYDGMGSSQTLKVFDMNDSGGQTGKYVLSCVFYEVQPVNKDGELLMNHEYFKDEDEVQLNTNLSKIWK